MKLRHEAEIQKNYEMFSDPAVSARFGIFSGAIWMGAIALFILFGFIISFRYSWTAFLFAVPAQLCIQGLMMKGKKQ
jgi:hypothetical protein